jgi:predicted RNA binding protein YcfA (HicA-like mRNA interferase family)
MKVRDVIKRVEADGWYLDRTKGSHRQFKHPDKLEHRFSIQSHDEKLGFLLGTRKKLWLK